MYAGDRKVDCHNGALVAQHRGGPQGVSKTHFGKTSATLHLSELSPGEAPLPALGFVAERLFLRRYKDRFLSRRNEILK